MNERRRDSLSFFRFGFSASLLRSMRSRFFAFEGVRSVFASGDFYRERACVSATEFECLAALS